MLEVNFVVLIFCLIYAVLFQAFWLSCFLMSLFYLSPLHCIYVCIGANSSFLSYCPSFMFLFFSSLGNFSLISLIFTLPFLHITLKKVPLLVMCLRHSTIVCWEGRRSEEVEKRQNGTG